MIEDKTVYKELLGGNNIEDINFVNDGHTSTTKSNNNNLEDKINKNKFINIKNNDNLKNDNGSICDLYKKSDLLMKPTLIAADIQQLPFIDNSFDGLFSCAILPHLTDDIKAIK